MAFERLGAYALGAGDDPLKIVIDTVHNKAYISTGTKILRVNLTSGVREAEVVTTPGALMGLAIDPACEYIYYIKWIDYTIPFETYFCKFSIATQTEVYAVSKSFGYLGTHGGVVDPSGRYYYCAWNLVFVSSAAGVSKFSCLDGSTAANLSWGTENTTSYNLVDRPVLDPASGYLFVPYYKTHNGAITNREIKRLSAANLTEHGTLSTSHFYGRGVLDSVNNRILFLRRSTLSQGVSYYSYELYAYNIPTLSLHASKSFSEIYLPQDLIVLGDGNILYILSDTNPNKIHRIILNSLTFFETVTGIAGDNGVSGEIALDTVANKLYVADNDATPDLIYYGVTIPPGPVEISTKCSVTEGSIEITLDLPVGTFDRVSLEKSTDGLTFTELVSIPAPGSTYTDTGVSEGATVYYRARAYADVTAYEYGSIVPAMCEWHPFIPAPPHKVRVSLDGLSTIITWRYRIYDCCNLVKNYIDGFRLERKRDDETVWTSLGTVIGPSSVKYPGTVSTESADGGSAEWTNPNNIKVEGGANDCATVSLTPYVYLSSDYLIATNFNFNLPAQAIIDGIIVSVRHAQISGIDFGKMHMVSLHRDGDIFGIAKMPAFWWVHDYLFHVWTAGDVTDFWGRSTITPDDINDPTFGALLRVVALADTEPAVLGIDAISIIVVCHGIVPNLAPSVRTFTDTTVISGHVYSYRLVAYNSIRESEPSKVVNITFPKVNLLSENQAGIETDLTGFAITAGTLTRVTTKAKFGLASAKWVTTHAGDNIAFISGPIGAVLGWSCSYGQIKSFSAYVSVNELLTGLVGYWKFEEPTWNGTPGEVVDSSGSNNHAVALGGALPAVTGKLDYGAQFDGVNDLINCENPASFQISEGAVGAWFKTDLVSEGYEGIIVKLNAFGVFQLAGNLAVYDWESTTTHITAITINDGQWHRIILNFKSGVGFTLYVDGVSRLTGTLTVVDQLNRLCIGAGATDGTISTQNFHGFIDEPAVWNRQLTLDEIVDDYNGGSGKSTNLTSVKLSITEYDSSDALLYAGESTQIVSVNTWTRLIWENFTPVNPLCDRVVIGLYLINDTFGTVWFDGIRWEDEGVTDF